MEILRSLEGSDGPIAMTLPSVELFSDFPWCASKTNSFRAINTIKREYGDGVIELFAKETVQSLSPTAREASLSLLASFFS